MKLTFETVDDVAPEVTADLDKVWRFGRIGAYRANYDCTDDVEIARCVGRANGARVAPGEYVIFVKSNHLRFTARIFGTLYVFGPELKLRAVGVDTSGNRTVAVDRVR